MRTTSQSFVEIGVIQLNFQCKRQIDTS